MNIGDIGTNLVFATDLSEVDFPVVDIGLELSKTLKGNLSNSQIALIANDALHEIIEEKLFENSEIRNGYAIKNIGILFEPLLKIDFVALCKKYSRDTFFFIEHKGDINDENLFFLTRQAGKKIDITDLNYTIL